MLFFNEKNSKLKGFIEVTEIMNSGERGAILINISHIIDVYPDSGNTKIWLTEYDEAFTVSESYEEVKELIRRAIS